MALTSANIKDLADTLSFDANGFVSAIVLDASTGEPLQFSFMNREAFEKTMETGKMHYWSRSRKKLWLKGETSGHIQTDKEVRLDCDEDALVFKVDQTVAACHTGHYSCFHRKLGPEGWTDEGRKKVFDPEEVYGKK